MGWQEALARSSTADFLEVAVTSGDLVPGRRGWKARQQELVRAHLDTPQPDLFGQTLAQVILTERAETWLSRYRSETRRRILAPIVNRLLQPAELPAATAADPLPPLRWLLDQLNGGIALTQTGNLSRAFVQQSADRFCWDFSCPPWTASLWRAVAVGLLGDNNFEALTGELFLACCWTPTRCPGTRSMRLSS